MSAYTLLGHIIAHQYSKLNTIETYTLKYGGLKQKMKKEQLDKVIGLLEVFIEMEKKSGFFSSLLCTDEDAETTTEPVKGDKK